MQSSYSVGSSNTFFRPRDYSDRLLVLHLHQVAQGTFTPKLSDMSDTQDAAANAAAPAEPARSVLDRASTVLG